MAHDGAGEALAAGGGAQDRDVAQALGQAASGRVGADQVQFDVRVPGCPAALELAGAPATAALAFPALGSAGVVAVRQCVAGAVLLTAMRPKVASFTRQRQH